MHDDGGAANDHVTPAVRYVNISVPVHIYIIKLITSSHEIKRQTNNMVPHSIRPS